MTQNGGASSICEGTVTREYFPAELKFFKSKGAGMIAESEKENLRRRGDDSPWYAVHTMPRHEKKVSSELKAKDICCFLPMISCRRQWSDRQRTIEAPLFAGYVFVRLAHGSPAKISLLRTKGVVGLVGNRGAGTPIPEDEIHAIQQVLDTRVPVAAHEFLNAGQRVRIRGGALDGLEGILQSFKGDQSLIVSIETIQRSISVTISGYDVEPISELTGTDSGIASQLKLNSASLD